MSPRGFLGGLEFELGIGGAGRIRTGDPLLAKQVLCQLSYDPIRGRENDILKNELRKIYFVRSTGTRKLSSPSTIDYADCSA